MQHEGNMHQTGIEISEDLTIPKLFYQQAGKYGNDRVAMREKEFGIWRPITWQDYLENVKYLALGLISLGLEDGDKEFGRYHALDLYTILSTTTEKEWNYALKLRDQNENQPYVLEAGHLVSEYFSNLDQQGMIRLRESIYYRPELQLDDFMSAIQELFPVSTDTSSS